MTELNTASNETYYTATKAAEIIRCNKKNLIRWIKDGAVQSANLGKQGRGRGHGYMIPESEVIRLMDTPKDQRCKNPETKEEIKVKDDPQELHWQAKYEALQKEYDNFKAAVAINQAASNDDNHTAAWNTTKNKEIEELKGQVSKANEVIGRLTAALNVSKTQLNGEKEHVTKLYKDLKEARDKLNQVSGLNDISDKERAQSKKQMDDLKKQYDQAHKLTIDSTKKYEALRKNYEDLAMSVASRTSESFADGYEKGFQAGFTKGVNMRDNTVAPYYKRRNDSNGY